MYIASSQQIIRWRHLQFVVLAQQNLRRVKVLCSEREPIAVVVGADAGTKVDPLDLDADSISGYAVDSVQYCVDKGIINGYDDGRFAPKDNATRAQIAAVIVRFIESVLSE